MARNIEIKARVGSAEGLALLAQKLARLADAGPTEIRQDDTFFRCQTGRLKLRAFSHVAGELIFYQRADQAGPKESFYVCSHTSDPAGLRQALSLACGEAGRVTKRRLLYEIGRTRVHLDEVERLGSFLELEVVLGEAESAESGAAVAHALMAALGIDPSQLVAAAYVDLLGEQE